MENSTGTRKENVAIISATRYQEWYQGWYQEEPIEALFKSGTELFKLNL
jgi:hypothetical protein